MSHYTDEPRFTIEQIDLLQRLRRTGMTKPEIVHALDTLERLDREHGDKYSRRGPSDSNATNSTTSSTTSSTTPTSNSTSNATMATSSTTSTATQTQFHGNLSPSPSNSYATSPPAVLPSPVSLVAMAQNGRDALAATPNGKLSPNRYPVNSAAAVRSYGLEGSEEDLDIDDKVEELMRRDSTLVKEEIKAFLGNRRISQAVVAQVTGQFTPLPQFTKNMKKMYRPQTFERSCIYFLYIFSGATLNMRPTPVSLDEMEWRQTPPPISSAPGSFRLRRGSRFTWRKECLAVMESYFSDNQYPDEAKREEIANACNAVIQKPGKKLSDLERVTSLKVYNWFANRRKEIKRRANIATILESHGIDVQSPGGHSNSDDVDANDYNEQDDAGIHADHQDPISLAVEMAAVNHSILALSRPGGVAIEIKTESLDDD
uniref:Homeobox-containing protein 1-like n=1 Tax=Sinocyclocheilus rhinocerous TaxID=307959 RepID=A0A673I342_9TELE